MRSALISTWVQYQKDWPWLFQALKHLAQVLITTIDDDAVARHPNQSAPCQRQPVVHRVSNGCLKSWRQWRWMRSRGHGSRYRVQKRTMVLWVAALGKTT
jgi:hypothetical protein